MNNEKSSLFMSEEGILKAAEELIDSGIYKDSPLLRQYSGLSANFGKLLKEYKKIVKISDNQQEYLQKVQKELKNEIDERVRIERTLAQTADRLAELNTVKDKLFAIVYHDIRDPLATLVSLTELLEDEKACLTQESCEIIDAVKEQVANTYTMVDNLLEWFRSQKGGMVFSPAIWELSIIVKEIAGIYRVKCEKKDICLTSEIADDILVFADREALELVIRNLVSNAVKFTCNGGSIHLSARKEDAKVTVFVKDTGTGMEAEKARKLFFEVNMGSSPGTDGEKGTGLGLLICKEFVQQNGGEIWVDSTPGRGSTFGFSVPSGSKFLLNEYQV